MLLERKRLHENKTLYKSNLTKFWFGQQNLGEASQLSRTLSRQPPFHPPSSHYILLRAWRAKAKILQRTMKLFFAVIVAFLVAFGAATKSVDYIEKRVLSKAVSGVPSALFLPSLLPCARFLTHNVCGTYLRKLMRLTLSFRETCARGRTSKTRNWQENVRLAVPSEWKWTEQRQASRANLQLVAVERARKVSRLDLWNTKRTFSSHR